MTDDSRTPPGQAHLSDAFLWLVGAPLTILDVLYLSRLAPPIEPERPETLILRILGVLAFLLLSWSLLSSACAHLALLRGAPPVLRRVAHALVLRCGTKLSRSLLARAGASALIGSALVTVAPVAASIATPQENPSAGVSLTWADSPPWTPRKSHHRRRRQLRPVLQRTHPHHLHRMIPIRPRCRSAIHCGRSPHPSAQEPTTRTSTRRGAQFTRPTRTLSPTRTSSTPDSDSLSPRTCHEHPNRTQISH